MAVKIFEVDLTIKPLFDGESILITCGPTVKVLDTFKNGMPAVVTVPIGPCTPCTPCGPIIPCAPYVAFSHCKEPVS